MAPLAAPKGGTYVVFVGADLKPSPKVAALIGAAGARLESAAKAVRFRGKASTAMDLVEAPGLDGVRLLVVGVAPGKDGKPIDFANLGGYVFGKLGAAKKVAVAFVAPEGEWDAGAGGRVRAGPAAARLPLRPLQDRRRTTATRSTTPRRR